MFNNKNYVLRAFGDYCCVKETEGSFFTSHEFRMGKYNFGDPTVRDSEWKFLYVGYESTRESKLILGDDLKISVWHFVGTNSYFKLLVSYRKETTQRELAANA